jgi:molybdate transport system substrate-binding protein
MRVLKILSLPLILMMLPLGSSCSQASELSIFAAAGAKAAIDEVCQKFEEKYGTSAIPSYGGGGEVLSQMILAKSGDIYVAPEQSFMQKAIAEGAVDAGTVTSIAYMIPVIAVPKSNPENIQTLADLARPGLQIAISRPETTLAGQYAMEMFEQAGLADAIAPNIATQAATPNALLTMLIMGQVDAVIIWHYYAYLNPDNIENVYIPAEQVTGIAEMQIAVSTYSQNPEAAQQFIDFAASDEGRAIFAQNGYIIDETEVEKYR